MPAERAKARGVYAGEFVYFHDESCRRAFEARREYLERMDRVHHADWTNPLAPDRDPVCGMTVDARSPAVSLREGDRLVRFCCESCRDAYEARQKYLDALLDVRYA